MRPSPSTNRGFTLVELMITTTIIAVIASIAIPNLLESRITANESAAATTMKSGVFPAQVMFQSGGYADSPWTDVGYSEWNSPPWHSLGGTGNGIGDYACRWGQLAGASARYGAFPEDDGGSPTLALLPQDWCNVAVCGIGKGYAVCPGGQREGAEIGGYIWLLAAANENGFSATAAPADGGASIGRRRFAINASGIVYSTLPADVNNEACPLDSATAPFGDGITPGAVPFNIPATSTGWKVHTK